MWNSDTAGQRDALSPVHARRLQLCNVPEGQQDNMADQVPGVRWLCNDVPHVAV